MWIINKKSFTFRCFVCNSCFKNWVCSNEINNLFNSLRTSQAAHFSTHFLFSFNGFQFKWIFFWWLINTEISISGKLLIAHNAVLLLFIRISVFTISFSTAMFTANLEFLVDRAFGRPYVLLNSVSIVAIWVENKGIVNPMDARPADTHTLMLDTFDIEIAVKINGRIRFSVIF